MKKTLLAFAVTPLIPATIFGCVGAVTVILRPEVYFGTSPLAGFLGAFVYGVIVSAAIAWTFGVVVFLILRRLKKESLATYASAGLTLGLSYGLLTKQIRAGGELASYLAWFCFYGVTASIGFWVIGRKSPNQIITAQRASRVAD